MNASSGASDGNVDRRTEIVRVATALFLEKGYAAASLSRIADEVGIRKASLYHHYPSKEALFVACATDGFEEAVATLAAIRDDPSLTDEERLRRAIAQLYVIIVDSNTGRMSPLIAEVSLRFPEVARAFREEYIERQHAIVMEILDSGVARGSFAPHDRLGVEHVIFGPIVNLCLSRQMFAPCEDLEDWLPVERIRDSHSDMVLRLVRAG